MKTIATSVLMGLTTAIHLQSMFRSPEDPATSTISGPDDPIIIPEPEDECYDEQGEWNGACDEPPIDGECIGEGGEWICDEPEPVEPPKLGECYGAMMEWICEGEEPKDGEEEGGDGS